MKNKNILHMGKPATTVNTYGGGITAAITDNEIAMNWVYNNYISIFCRTSDELYFHDNSYWEQYACPFMFNFMVPREFLKDYNISIKNLIIDSINRNSYLGLYVDKFYIPMSDQYNQKHFYHGIFIYGYDMNKNTTYVCTNLQDGKFVHVNIDFDDLEKAYWEMDDSSFYINKVHIFKKLTENELTETYPLDKRVIKTGIYNYINSICTLKIESSSSMIFGYNAILHLIETLEKNNNQAVDHRVFHLLWDNKMIMVDRLKLMSKINMINDDGNYARVYDKIAKNYLSLRNLVLKYNMTRNHGILPRIYSSLQQFSSDELITLREIYNLL